jgi:CrcB protein
MIGLGGMLGAYARYRLSGWVYARTGADFPWGTLAVNLCGSFVLGFLLPLLERLEPALALRGFVYVGLIGAFTTFSTFAYEAVMLLLDGERLRAGLYVAASLGLGLLSIAAGLQLGHILL